MLKAYLTDSLSPLPERLAEKTAPIDLVALPSRRSPFSDAFPSGLMLTFLHLLVVLSLSRDFRNPFLFVHKQPPSVGV
ncbi:unnamed protein product [Haemonchus placei]|uniref:Uncharacterized protein n=1 Tax=Haemonchus placei TaxID=6290 RepID=A0A3P8BFZ6_HAEPC|nr:unnamed protein product [Haemonchus placei]